MVENKGPATGTDIRMKGQSPSKPSNADDPRFNQAMQSYQDGLRLLQERKFDRARALFQKVADIGIRQLSDRAKVHLQTCNQHLEHTATSFNSLEEHYDYAVSLINLGDYITAREHLETILKQSPNSDYALYGMAVLDCLTGQYEDSLRRLEHAIRLNRSNRFQARNDSDFKNLADDPRFTELLYPESVVDDFGDNLGR
jgi:tetratricopeptide (TPR) repeat protein